VERGHHPRSTTRSDEPVLLGIMFPEVSPDTPLGSGATKCVNSRGGDDVVTGVNSRIC
jgi:hypothetical protein